MGTTSLHFRVSSCRYRVVAWTLLTTFLCSFVPAISVAQQPTATISTLIGTVLVNGQEEDTGVVLSAGDVIETQAGATIVLELSDGSLLELRESTTIILTELTQTAAGARISRVTLQWGHIRAKLSQDHQAAGSSFKIETPNALVDAHFSQPDIEVSYDPANEETIALARTVALSAKNLITDEEKMIPVGAAVIITALGMKVTSGTAAAGLIASKTAESTAAAETTAAGTTTAATTAGGVSTGTMVAVGAGALVAVGAVAAVAASSGGGDDGGGATSGNGGGGGSTSVPNMAGTWSITQTLTSNSCNPAAVGQTTTGLMECTQSGTSINLEGLQGSIDSNGNFSARGTTNSITTTITGTVNSSGTFMEATVTAIAPSSGCSGTWALTGNKV